VSHKISTFFYPTGVIIANKLYEESKAMFNSEIEVGESYFRGKHKEHPWRGYIVFLFVTDFYYFWTNQSKRHIYKFNGSSKAFSWGMTVAF
jgi:hypothetical protein